MHMCHVFPTYEPLGYILESSSTEYLWELFLSLGF